MEAKAHPRAKGLLQAGHFVPLAGAVFLIGLADAVAGSYVTLFAVEKAGMRPLMLGIFLTLGALSGIGFSAGFGHWLDRSRTMVPLLLSLLATAITYAALAVTTGFIPLCLIAALPLGVSAAAFPQLFAIARGHLAELDAATAERGTAVLRAIWSVAWAVGPALGAAMVGLFDFAGAFFTSAACGLAAMASVTLVRVRPGTHAGGPQEEAPGAPARRRTIAFAAAALALFHMAMFLGSNAMPIVTTAELGGSKTDVGLIFSLCAFLEVLVLATFALRPSGRTNYGGLYLGFIVFIVYFAVMFAAGSLAVVLAAQLARAIAIALLGYLGISYMQALMPDRPGAAAALFSNTTQVGSLLSAAGTGLWAELFGFRSMFLACIGLSMAGLICLALSRPRPPG